MDELAGLMEELTVSLKAKVQATQRTEQLLNEVSQIPKLDIGLNKGAAQTEQNNLLHKLQLQLELQNLNHFVAMGTETAEYALMSIYKLRSTANKFHLAKMNEQKELIENFEQQISSEREKLMEINREKALLVEDLVRMKEVLENVVS